MSNAMQPGSAGSDPVEVDPSEPGAVQSDPTGLASTAPFSKAGPAEPLSAEEAHKIATDLTSDYSKQLTTLATGVVALSWTFIKEILKADLNAFWSIVLVVSWAFLLMAVGLGFLVQGKLIGNIWSKRSPDVYDEGLFSVWKFQAVSFFLGILLFAILAGANFLWSSATKPTVSDSGLSVRLPENSTTTLVPDQGLSVILRFENQRLVVESRKAQNEPAPLDSRSGGIPPTTTGQAPPTTGRAPQDGRVEDLPGRPDASRKATRSPTESQPKEVPGTPGLGGGESHGQSAAPDSG